MCMKCRACGNSFYKLKLFTFRNLPKSKAKLPHCSNHMEEIGALVCYHDMHNRYGELLTWRSMKSHPRFSMMWRQYLEERSSSEHTMQELLVEYIDKFTELFGIHPISFHGHSSDAAMPTTIASLLLHLASVSSSLYGGTYGGEPVEKLGWRDTQRQSPRLAIIPGSFGAGYGPLAAVCPFSESVAVACGSTPIIVDPHQERDKLCFELKDSVAKGAIGMLVQIVSSTQPCHVIQPCTLKTLAEVCEEIGLPLIVDETVTAIRCGAPFAYQREEYRGAIDPDIVIFGKGLKVCGLSVNFDGASLGRLGIGSEAHRKRAIFRWHDVHTRAVSIPNLVEALHILTAASEEKWPARSRMVGQAVRSMILEHEKDTVGERITTPISGLEALICVERRRIEGLVLQGIPDGPHLRLLPVLDQPMADDQFLKECVVGQGSHERRLRLSADMRRQQRCPMWCYVCGDAVEGILGDDVRWCEDCCISTCGYEACEEGYLNHPCLGLRAKL